jgi:putative transposase
MDDETENLVVQMAKENPGRGYDRIVGALANLGHKLSDQTVGNILRRHDIPPAPKRKHTTSWKDFIRAHLDVLAGTDFFTVEVVTLKGLITYYVLFFIRLESRKVYVAGMTPHPDEVWMQQMARNLTLEQWGLLGNCRYLLHDRDGKFCPAFDQILEAVKVEPILLPARSPQLELLRGTLGEICQRGLPIEADSLRTVFPPASPPRIRRALSSGAQPSRQREQTPVSFTDSSE